MAISLEGSIASWLVQRAPQQPALAAALATLAQDKGLTETKLDQAFAALPLDAAARAKLKTDFVEAFVRPDATHDFYNVAGQQAAWQSLLASQRAERAAVAFVDAAVPADLPLLVTPADAADVLDKGAVWRDGDTMQVSDAAAGLATTLETNSHHALAATTFTERNSQNAAYIAEESALLAARSVGVTDPATVEKIRHIFLQAALEAGEAFRGAFNDDGTKKTDPAADDARKKAQGAAGGIALRFLPRLLEAIAPLELGVDRNERVAKIISGASVEDVAAIVARDLSMPGYPTGQQIVDNLKEIVPQTDYFYGQIDKIPTHGPAQKLLSLAVRLANTTWKAGQVHRAAWEGTDKRIVTKTEGRLGIYNPYDNLKADMFNATFQAELKKALDGGAERRDAVQRARDLAFSRVIFEVYKDLIELKSAVK